MPMMTRRASVAGMAGMLGLAAASGLSRATHAQPAPQPPIPPEGIGSSRIKHISYSDLGGRADSVQIMLNRGHVYVGHMFSDGVTVMDARDPRNLKPVHFFTTAPNTRTHHLQVAEDLMLLANGANIVRMQSYDSLRGYFENTLADSLTNRQPFRAGLSIHDISKPAEPKEIAFLDMPGIGINRLWWPGGRYAYVSAHFDGFTDHILCIVDLKTITKPEIVSKWWLPGMNRAGGEADKTPKGKRYALHHMITAGNRGYAAWRDGGFTIHDISDPANPKLLSHINWSPPFPGGTHTPLPLPGRKLAVVADESNADYCAKGLFYTWLLDVRAEENPVPIATLPTPTDRNDYCRARQFRAAQSAREPPRLVPERGDHLRHLSRCGRARVRHQGSVPAQGNRLLGAAAAEENVRSAPERRQMRDDLRLLRDAVGPDVCERLERRHARAAI